MKLLTKQDNTVVELFIQGEEAFDSNQGLFPKSVYSDTTKSYQLHRIVAPVFHWTLGLMEKLFIPHTQNLNIVSITKFTSDVSCWRLSSGNWCCFVNIKGRPNLLLQWTGEWYMRRALIEKGGFSRRLINKTCSFRFYYRIAQPHERYSVSLLLYWSLSWERVQMQPGGRAHLCFLSDCTPAFVVPIHYS